jgi:hypothetical protein
VDNIHTPLVLGVLVIEAKWFRNKEYGAVLFKLGGMEGKLVAIRNGFAL